MRRRSPEEHRPDRGREFVTVDTPATFEVETGSDGAATRRMSETAMSPGAGAVS